MDDIDPDKARAALEQLKAEKERRLQAKINSGEVVSVQTVVVVHPDEDEEEATARALARHPVPDDGRAVHREFFYVSTGVPRPGLRAVGAAASTNSFRGRDFARPFEEPAASGVASSPRSQPTYVRVTIRNGTDDGDPGAIAEARYIVEDGCVVLTDLDGKHMTSRALLKGQDPAAVARALLREAEEPKSFARPIRYPKLGLA